MYPVPDFPDQIYIELTNACNARCTTCATPQMQRPRKVMSFDLFKKIVDQCAEHRARRILPFLHGESFLVPEVLDYFAYVRKVSPASHLNVTTNGSKLSPEITEKILADDLLDSMIVSIDGGNKETFEKIRLGLSYDQVRGNVLHFIKRRKELKKTRPQVSIAMVTTPQNKHTRAELQDAWREADAVRFSLWFNWAGQIPKSTDYSGKQNFCERLFHYMTILADGRIALCCFDSEGEHTIGDANVTPLVQIWKSPEFQRLRSLMYEKQFQELPLCSKCDFINQPAWAQKAIRYHPYMQQNFPRVTYHLENMYKRWLMR
ncbi:MAG TPA: radical SAM/SPASM domain-containing protein [Acidobacteriota bacterium]|jgi:radical SAM protein with 4Fe4S-binding SPASM domain